MSQSVSNTGSEPVAVIASANPNPTATALFLGITGAVDPDQLRLRAADLAALRSFPGVHLTLAYPGAETARTPLNESVDLLSYPLPTAEGVTSPWAQTAAAQAALLALSSESQPLPGAVALLHPDLEALAPPALVQLAAPVLSGESDLVMAAYAMSPFDGLLNRALLAPLNRALYGKRVHFPLAPDFVLSPRLAARLAVSTHSRSAGTGTSVLWPATVAAGIDASVSEAQLNLQHPSPAGDMDLSAVLTQLVGSVFAEMETHAPLWQRVRPSSTVPPAPRFVTPVGAASLSSSAHDIDTAPMVKSFLLGSRSLQDVWGLLLPPVTLLDLKRLALLPAERFRMPDELWVRIVYDFALGYRLRTLNRTHLLGALTPLYLGWVASFINEASTDPIFDSEARYEKLARAFEDGKPYLVRRWRWPDRFNP